MRLKILALVGAALFVHAASAQTPVTRYVRYSHNGAVAYGILNGETIRELKGSPFARPVET